jgi:hypothetical protein
MAVGQRQRLYSGVRLFTGNYLSSPPQILRIRGVQLERTPLAYIVAQNCPGLPLSFLININNHTAHPCNHTIIQYRYYTHQPPLIRVRPPGYFTHISITTPIVPALKNYYTQGFLEFSAFGGYFKPLLVPGGGFRSEAAVTYSNCFGSKTITNL